MLVKFANEAYTIPAGHAVSGKLNRPHAIKVSSGRVWLTVEGWDADHWLKAGDTFTLPADRLIVMESDKQASSIEALSNKPVQPAAVEHIKRQPVRQIATREMRIV